MQARYENWTNGLNGDWCVSRQRFFGVPFPVWYPLDAWRAAAATTRIRSRRSRISLPHRSVHGRARRLPRRSARRAWRIHRRSRRHGHLGDLVAHAADRLRLARTIADLFARTFPMDLRPQAHDIIRTWLFDPCCDRTSSIDVAALGAMRRSPAGSSIRTARRCRSRRATS